MRKLRSYKKTLIALLGLLWSGLGYGQIKPDADSLNNLTFEYSFHLDSTRLSAFNEIEHSNHFKTDSLFKQGVDSVYYLGSALFKMRLSESMIEVKCKVEYLLNRETLYSRFFDFELRKLNQSTNTTLPYPWSTRIEPFLTFRDYNHLIRNIRIFIAQRLNDISWIYNRKNLYP